MFWAGGDTHDTLKRFYTQGGAGSLDLQAFQIDVCHEKCCHVVVIAIVVAVCLLLFWSLLMSMMIITAIVLLILLTCCCLPLGHFSSIFGMMIKNYDYDDEFQV
jgi:hypothetical protein